MSIGSNKQKNLSQKSKKYRKVLWDFWVGVYISFVGLCIMILNSFSFVEDWILLLIAYILLFPAIIYLTIQFKKIRRERSIDRYREYLLQELEKKETENLTQDEEVYVDGKNIDDTNPDKAVDIRRTGEKDIIAQMLDNNNEIKEYFRISKSQAKSSFWFSVIACIVGVFMLGLAIYGAVVVSDFQIAIIGTISGTITEVISGTVLWVHNKSALQLNHYYDALHQNEKFLSAINLADKLRDEKREEMYIEIIRKQIDIHLSNENKT